MNEFQPVINGVLSLIGEWEPKLLSLSEEVITCVKTVRTVQLNKYWGI